MKEHKKHQILRRFAINSIIAIVIWMILYYGFIVPDGKINSFLTNTVVQGTMIGLRLLGFESSQQGRIVFIGEEPVVEVADSCNALELFALYAGFLICFPGRIKFKLLFIPLGIILIYLINVLREITLALNYKFYRESFEFNHKYTYVLIVYIFVFAIWRFWIKKYSIISEISRSD